MRAACYIRVSTSKQEFALQMEAISKAVTADGGDPALIERYCDEASGWKSVRRPGLDALLKDCDQGKLRGSVLYIFALSRLTRKGTKDTLVTLDKLALGGVQVKSVTESFVNTTDGNPFRDVVIATFATVAKLESQAKSDRMTAWHQLKAKAGERVGRKPVDILDSRLRSIMEGKASIGETARELRCSRGAVRNALEKYRRENGEKETG